MERVAIFVDAGYLFAAGSTSIVGINQSRVNLVLNRVAIVDKLRAIADNKANNITLLRIYWYDGVSARGLSYEQESLADMDDVKLRLGIINPYGQQKGVDSLIVTDIVELARNHAISDAILLSGDEDVRIGVQIAQSFGVRVHLLGIEPSRGNQAGSLRQEADTTTEWSKSDVAEILAIREDATSRMITVPSVSANDAAIEDISSALDSIVDEFVARLNQDELDDVAKLSSGSLLPREFDGRLLAASRNRISRSLDESEKRYVRNRFREQARAKRNIIN